MDDAFVGIEGESCGGEGKGAKSGEIFSVPDGNGWWEIFFVARILREDHFRVWGAFLGFATVAKMGVVHKAEGKIIHGIQGE